MKRARNPSPEQSFRAGCGRTLQLASDAPDLAYTQLAYPECPTCPHLVNPEGVNPEGQRPFCTWRPARSEHPFAALGGLELPE